MIGLRRARGFRRAGFFGVAVFFPGRAAFFIGTPPRQGYRGAAASDQGRQRQPEVRAAVGPRLRKDELPRLTGTKVFANPRFAGLSRPEPGGREGLPSGASAVGFRERMRCAIRRQPRRRRGLHQAGVRRRSLGSLERSRRASGGSSRRARARTRRRRRGRVVLGGKREDEKESGANSGAARKRGFHGSSSDGPRRADRRTPNRLCNLSTGGAEAPRTFVQFRFVFPTRKLPSQPKRRGHRRGGSGWRAGPPVEEP
jgi:hypothetical protein